MVFDLDGTVVDTVELIVESFRHATRAVLHEVLPDETILAGVGQPLMAQMRRLSAEHAQESNDVYREYQHRRHDELIRGYEGVAEMLYGCAPPAVRLGIVTSKSADDHADGVQGGRSARVLRGGGDGERHGRAQALADPAPALPRAHGRVADDALYAGDSPVDIEAGRAAGMTTAAVVWGVFGGRRCSPPDRTTGWTESRSCSTGVFAAMAGARARRRSRYDERVDAPPSPRKGGSGERGEPPPGRRDRAR